MSTAGETDYDAQLLHLAFSTEHSTLQSIVLIDKTASQSYLLLNTRIASPTDTDRQVAGIHAGGGDYDGVLVAGVEDVGLGVGDGGRGR
jgi:hypothetical protein